MYRCTITLVPTTNNKGGATVMLHEFYIDMPSVIPAARAASEIVLAERTGYVAQGVVVNPEDGSNLQIIG